jgi:hypothetical protein
MRLVACLAVLALSGCAGAVDAMRASVEGGESTMGPALAQQKQALDGGCLANAFEGKSLRELMAATPDAKQVPVKETGSPTATAAWKIGPANPTYVMQLPDGACSASVTLGNPQQLYDAALALLQARAAFTRGQVDTSAKGDAERTTFCTAGAYPYVVAIYKRTTGSRAAFLANVFKAQGVTFSACRPNG